MKITVLKTAFCYLAVIPLVIAVSCDKGSPTARVDISLVNNTRQSFEWTEIHFGDNVIEFGILGGDAGGGGKTYVKYGKPITESADIKLTGTDHRMTTFHVNVAGIYNPKIPGTLEFEIEPMGVVPHFTPLK